MRLSIRPGTLSERPPVPYLRVALTCDPAPDCNGAYFGWRAFCGSRLFTGCPSHPLTQPPQHFLKTGASPPTHICQAWRGQAPAPSVTCSDNFPSAWPSDGVFSPPFFFGESLLCWFLHTVGKDRSFCKSFDFHASVFPDLHVFLMYLFTVVSTDYSGFFPPNPCNSQDESHPLGMRPYCLLFHSFCALTHCSGRAWQVSFWIAFSSALLSLLWILTRLL